MRRLLILFITLAFCIARAQSDDLPTAQTGTTSWTASANASASYYRIAGPF